MNPALQHYEDTMRVKAHAAIHYAENCGSCFNALDKSNIQTDSAHLSNLLKKGATGGELQVAGDDLFSSITFAIKRRKEL